jgi:Uma2 family endonuclease
MAMPASVIVPTYTIEDLERFPDDGNRYELLDGVLLVTPAPLPPHEVVIGRLFGSIANYLHPSGLGHVVARGAVEIVPKTHLEPDILVFPADQPLDRKWAAIRDWWLAVEVFSESSKIYDRDFKRNAYLAMGVAEVWLVDWWGEAVYVSRPGEPEDIPHADRFTWYPAAMERPLEIELSEVFRGLP